MHLEVLVEDQSGKTFLDIALRRMISGGHTFQVHAYKGIGRIPKDLRSEIDASKRILLDQLPRLLRGYGAAFSKYPHDYHATVMVLCDLDNRDLLTFCAELMDVLDACTPKPNVVFAFAIEEGEAWLLGDIAAIKTAYPNARERVLREYVNDSICGTWEWLANAIYPGGSEGLLRQGWQTVGAEKSNWASKITPHIEFETNQSPSFQNFRAKIALLLAKEKSS